MLKQNFFSYFIFVVRETNVTCHIKFSRIIQS